LGPAFASFVVTWAGFKEGLSEGE